LWKNTVPVPFARRVFGASSGVRFLVTRSRRIEFDRPTGVAHTWYTDCHQCRNLDIARQ
jgi:hypothetical protein